jgi:hypothetical protein
MICRCSFQDITQSDLPNMSSSRPRELSIEKVEGKTVREDVCDTVAHKIRKMSSSGEKDVTGKVLTCDDDVF